MRLRFVSSRRSPAIRWTWLPLAVVVASGGVLHAASPALDRTVVRWQVDPQTPPAARREVSVDEVQAMAFGAGSAARVRRWRREPWVVMTDAPAFDGAALVGTLADLYQRMRYRDFPFIGDADRPAVLLVFDGRRAQQAFWQHLGERVHARFITPSLANLAGEAALGVGTTWTEGLPPAAIFPVALHEATHALAQQLFDIDRMPSWLAEGIAARYEWIATGRDLRPAVQAARATGSIPSLGDLMGATSIPSHGYLPAALLVDWLLDDPLRRSQLAVLYDEARQGRTPDLPALLEKHTGLSMTALESQWLAWLDRRFLPQAP